MAADTGNLELTDDQLTVDKTGSIVVVNNKQFASAVQSKLEDALQKEASAEVEFSIKVTIKTN